MSRGFDDALGKALPAVEPRWLGLRDYVSTWSEMQSFTARRSVDTADELWIVEHPPVYTRGMRCRESPLGEGAHIPIVDVDRGGLLTYHGPGQLVVYVLVDIRRRGWGVVALVRALEQSVIELLHSHGVDAERHAGAPGVFVGGAKVAQLGLRIKRGASYHGLSINVDMDLSPFSWIDPCGMPGLEVTQLRDLGIDRDIADISNAVISDLQRRLRSPITA